MSDAQQQVSDAREAFARGDWSAARNGMEIALDTVSLGTADLDILARSHWWLGDVEHSITVSEQIFHRLVREGNPGRAGMVALTLALQWGVRGDLVVSSAWLSRSRRILEGLPEGPEHGYMLYIEGNDAMDLEGDAGPAFAASVRLKEMALRHRAPELASFGHLLSGLAAVRTGQAARGFQELDEAMLPVMAGQVPVEWAGDIYCSVIHLCHEMADFARMRAWTDALAKWCARLSESFMYSGISRVHELQLLSAEGGWNQVEAEMVGLAERLRHAHGWISAAGYCELGNIRRRRGDKAGAERAFGLARDLGVDPQPGAALLLADSGRTHEAVDALRAAMGQRGPLGRAWLLLPAVELLAPFDRDAARFFCGELEQTASFYGTPGFLAWASHARGVLLMTEHRWPEALEELESAAQSYRSQHLRYELARIHERLATVRAALGEKGTADAERATAAAIRAQLGAVDTAQAKVRQEPGGLTSREVEVLGCVLAGSSNRQIAAALTITEKTAGRHLANIFTKIGVTSRTAAAAWARQHGIPQRPHA